MSNKAYSNLVSTKGMPKEEWLEWRKKGIGGSDVAAICGFNKWKCAVDVAMDKLNLSEEKEFDNPYPTYWGQKEEPIVVELFEKKTGLKVKRNNHILQSIKYPFMYGNLDRWGIDKDGKRFVLEIKTTDSFNRKAWADGNVPFPAYLQTLHYLIITDYDYAYIAVKIGNIDFKYVKIERNAENEAYISETLRKFWSYIEKNEIPPSDEFKVSEEALKILYPEARDKEIIELKAEIEEKISLRQSLYAQKKELDEQIKDIDTEIKANMGDHEVGHAGNYVLKWADVSSYRLDTKRLKAEHPEIIAEYSKETKSRRFSIKETA